MVDKPALLRVQNLVFYDLGLGLAHFKHDFKPALLLKCTIVFEFIFQQASEQKQATTFFKTCHLLYIDAVNSVGNFLLLFSDWQTFFLNNIIYKAVYGVRPRIYSSKLSIKKCSKSHLLRATNLCTHFNSSIFVDLRRSWSYRSLQSCTISKLKMCNISWSEPDIG